MGEYSNVLSHTTREIKTVTATDSKKKAPYFSEFSVDKGHLFMN